MPDNYQRNDVTVHPKKRACLFFSLFVFAFISGITAQEITLDSKKWKLTWSDEFKGPKIDKTKWSHVTVDSVGGGYGNNELQFYVDHAANSSIKSGKLVITALKEKFQKYGYTSAKLVTKNKAAFTYGKFSFRAKVPKGKGIWPAIWMLPTDMKKYGDWPACGEIDIMELVGHKPKEIHGTLHYGTPWKYTGKKYELPKGDFSDDFHIFEIIWLPGKIQWFVDGKHYSTQTDWFTSGAKYPAPYDRDFYIILNLAVGGKWPGSPNEQTVFPAHFEIDWCRVYKYGGDLPKVNKPVEPVGKQVKVPYPVYSEGLGKSVFHPSGLMGNFAAMKIDLNSTEKPHKGKTCMKVHYSQNDNWSGLLYQNPINDWGDKKGGIDLTKAKELSFWARSATGGEKIKFGMGLIGKNKQFYDSYKIEKEFVLTQEWKEYTFKLPSDKLTHIKTGFSFAFGGQGKQFIFYLDDIIYK